MYITELVVQDIGKIDNIWLREQDLFTNGQSPKPIVLVGENGTNKTTVLAIIADMFYEVQKKWAIVM